ncbi:16S rRNA (guanine(966)-N(2))-methyltransferase RsmD [Pedobacter glucosidilyticus]|uniref:16S rRNA (guanine(966)-N(2))-methyltransferase RsmD n=1 Tax=Pedobacter glucosidilyticus TaxID=1122941 RepID=UPI0026F080A7|nr:16S rRNA (guanine(966)-N(2))-methyltransferase RsmD [Pedobacter glucosidilyticus]
MRIIGGTLKGIRLNPPKKLPVRPTTDIAKEALFNILTNQLEISDLKILDLFSGTGNISLEFASRGAQEIIAVDRDFGCYGYLKAISKDLNLTQIKAIKSDVFKFLNTENQTFDLIFADPPYDLTNIPEIAKIIFNKQLLKPGGILIIEHQSMQNLAHHPNFTDVRKYGYAAFSFFTN